MVDKPKCGRCERAMYSEIELGAKTGWCFECEVAEKYGLRERKPVVVSCKCEVRYGTK